MEGIADFLDSLIGGIDLSLFAFMLGSIAWGLFVLKPWEQDKNFSDTLLQSSVKLLYIGAFGLLITQLLKIVLKIWLMNVTLNIWPFPAFAHTIQFQAGLWRALFALVIAIYSYYVLKNKADSESYWQYAAWLCLPLLFAGAWLVHAAGRLDNRIYLMTLTVIHQIAAAIWIGGIVQLVNLWILSRNDEHLKPLWPILLGRFSYLGMITVAVLIASGLPMALSYIPNWNGLIGTGYGNLVLIKIILLFIALSFAFLNRSAVQEFRKQGHSTALYHRVPHYIEAETFVLVTLLFTAASLSSQPPAIDIPDLTATWQEVLNMFAPRIPRTSSPSHTALLAGEAGRVAIVGQIPSEAATAWSDYNHNISGIFLTVMSFFAMLSYHRQFNWARNWPIGFILLGVFLFFRSDAETWPMGPIGFWESMSENGEVLQHRIATVLVLALGFMELKARITNDPNSRLPYVFPFLSAFGGLMLLTHSHVGFQAKTTFLIQVGHTLMGVFSLILACGRWLELKLDKPGSQIAGFISVFALFQIGIILMFYREPLY